MNPQDTYHFNQLKKAVFGVFSKRQSVPDSFENFGKDDIVAFQEDLLDRLKTRVSEKWFYTYFKNTPEKLPRIDMLNLLSQYAGFQNWNEFKSAHNKNHSKKRKMLWIIALLLIVVLGFVVIPKGNSYHFCFVDQDKNEAIINSLDIEVLLTDQSSVYLKTDEYGCFTYTSSADDITFVVSSNYYKTDTIFRSSSHQEGVIPLQVDEYALMLDYYSKGNKKNVLVRKQQLETLIDDNAVIYQLYPNKNEVEIYSKSEFISLLMIPTSSLKNIEYLGKEFKEDKIVKLKFIVK